MPCIPSWVVICGPVMLAMESDSDCGSTRVAAQAAKASPGQLLFQSLKSSTCKITLSALFASSMSRRMAL